MRFPIIIKLDNSKPDLYGFLTDVALPKGALLKMNGVLYEALSCKRMNDGYKVDLKVKEQKCI